jgi:pimeloyl-ACP methyl ester carboxylesterase
MTMEHITSLDGTQIGFRRSGSGPPLLLVHGTTAVHTRWDSISDHFEEHFTVYAMDRRGRGASGDAAVYHISREMEDVAAVVDAIGGSVSVVGHSYGAVCSLEAALLTDKISKLIIYEPPIPTGLPSYPPGIPKRLQALIDGGEWEAALELFFREVVRMPEHELVDYRQLPVWQTRIQLAPTIARELAFDKTYRFETDKFVNLQTPTLLLLGGDSPPLFQRAADLVSSTLPNCTVQILPGEQHIAMDTNPDLFVSEVLKFLMG